MVALAIILGIIAFFALIFNMRIKVTVEMKDELFLTVSVLGIKIPILPKKPKKYKIRNYTPKKIAKRDAKAEKKAARVAQRRAKRKAEKALRKKQGKQQKLKFKDIIKKLHELPPIPDMMSLFLNIIKILFSGLFKKFHFHVDRLRIKVGGADAAQIALIYTAITNGLHPVFAFLDEHSNLHGANRANVEISTDYLSDKIVADVKLGFSTTLGGVLGAILKALFKAVVGWIKITENKSANDENTQSDTPQSLQNTQKSGA